jgi:hypothetical protein
MRASCAHTEKYTPKKCRRREIIKKIRDSYILKNWNATTTLTTTPVQRPPGFGVPFVFVWTMDFFFFSSAQTTMKGLKWSVVLIPSFRDIVIFGNSFFFLNKIKIYKLVETIQPFFLQRFCSTLNVRNAGRAILLEFPWSFFFFLSCLCASYFLKVNRGGGDIREI